MKSVVGLHLLFFAHFYIFVLARRLYLVCNEILRRISGGAAPIDQLKQKNTLQISKIVFRSPTLSVTYSSTSLFATKHEKFHPMAYLERPDVSLYSVEDDFVYFVQTSSYREVFDTRMHPFTYLGQTNLAERLIKVHYTNLVDFANSKRKPQQKVVWVHHSLRCGSTAMAQAFNAMDDWTVLSELSWMSSTIPLHLQTYDEISAYMTGGKFYQVAKACLVVQLMRYPDDAKVCWRTNCQLEGYLLPLIMKEFPEHAVLFLTRSGDKTAKSLYDAFKGSYVTKFHLTRLNVFPTYLVRRLVGLIDTVYNLTNGMFTPDVVKFWFDGSMSEYQMCYSIWITSVALVRDIGKAHPDIRFMLVEYESYKKNIEANLKKVFEYADISMDNFQEALAAYKYDSQTNSFVARSAVDSKGPVSNGWQPDEVSLRKCNKLAKSLGLGAFDSELTREFFGSNKNLAFIMD